MLIDPIVWVAVKKPKETRGRPKNPEPAKSIMLTFQADEYQKIQAFRRKHMLPSDALAARRWLQGIK
ncbi:MAG TPA: hypothetical protein ENI05_08910 [Porticoccus sp.]|nr:hypothetical protein [Porticoccus sp.]